MLKMDDYARIRRAHRDGMSVGDPLREVWSAAVRAPRKNTPMRGRWRAGRIMCFNPMYFDSSPIRGNGLYLPAR